MRFFLVVLMLAVVACAHQTDAHACKVQIEQASWNMEIASTDEERQKGLMFRSLLPDDTGMIFVFPTSRKIAMWMKNTLIPLDMVFVDENLQIVGIHENATPLSEDTIQLPAPSKYVLELNAGDVKEKAIKPGQRLDLSQCLGVYR